MPWVLKMKTAKRGERESYGEGYVWQGKKKAPKKARKISKPKKPAKMVEKTVEDPDGWGDDVVMVPADKDAA